MSFDRRLFLQSLAAGLGVVGQGWAGVDGSVLLEESALRVIPSSGEKVPCVGMGSWITFDIARDEVQWAQRVEVLRRFFEMGGTFIDSSPMYGFAEEVIGFCLRSLQARDRAFAASKIWTPVAFDGRGQMKSSEDLWGKRPMDLMFVHNLLALRKHLPQLREWKQSGRIRYVGVSTSHGRRHAELEQLLRTEELDFVQLTLNIEQTAAIARACRGFRLSKLGAILFALCCIACCCDLRYTRDEPSSTYARKYGCFAIGIAGCGYASCDA